jgi:hypothetical protein
MGKTRPVRSASTFTVTHGRLYERLEKREETERVLAGALPPGR